MSVGLAQLVRGSNSGGGGENFSYCPDRPWGPPRILYNGYRVFFGGKERPGRDVEPSPTSSAVGHERVELYLYSPYGPYGLYRVSVPVKRWPLPLPLFVLFISMHIFWMRYLIALKRLTLYIKHNKYYLYSCSSMTKVKIFVFWR